MEHSFNPIFAQRYGIIAAVIFHDLMWWIRHNKANGTHFKDGRTWTYNSANEYIQYYPYMGKSQIYSAFKKMIADGLVLKSEYNSDKWNHMPWYTITDKGYEVFLECENLSAELAANRKYGCSSEIEQSTCENQSVDVPKNKRRRRENINVDEAKTVTSNTDTPSYTPTVSNSNTLICVFEIPLRGGDVYRVTQSEIDEYKEAYPNVEIEQEYRNMIMWCKKNPTKRKAKAGVERFINNWLCRKQSGRYESTKPEQKPTNTGIDRRNTQTAEPYGGGTIV